MRAEHASDSRGLGRLLSVIKATTARERLSARRIRQVMATQAGARSDLSLGAN